MSDFIVTDRRLFYIRDLPCSAQSEKQNCPTLLMPFEPNTQEAKNLEDALGFLFILMPSCDELIEQYIPAGVDDALH